MQSKSNNRIVPLYTNFTINIIMTLVKVKVTDFYNHPELYPFMPQAVFDALESAYLSGENNAEISLTDLIELSHKLILNHGPENN